MKKIRILILAIVGILILTASTTERKTTIFTIGDSTMANKKIAGDAQERGWGMMLQNFFTEDIIVDNHAQNGRSSKSFIGEGRWQKVLDKIKPGDYVFIQFGHNDEKKDERRHTDPSSTFDANLRRFVLETREKGGIPVLFNCVVRRNFTAYNPYAISADDKRQSKHNLVEGDTLYDTHGDYRYAPRNVAKELNVPFIDANKITHELEQGLGREGSKKLHMIFEPGETPSLPEGRKDNTHYNIFGGRVVAGLMVDAVAKEVPQLKDKIRHYDIVVAKDGSGQYFDVQQAVDAAPIDRKTSILVCDGEWERPNVPSYKKIKFVMRSGAKWTK